MVMIKMGADAALAGLIFIVAVLYASVGQAGASGYLAAMGVMGLAPAVMKPTALALNVIVAGIGTYRFWRAGQFSWRSFYPFGILGLPFSFLGGMLHLPQGVYYPVIGGVLLLGAATSAVSAWKPLPAAKVEAPSPPVASAVIVGALVGFTSGVTGTGGGVFLSPILLATGWIGIRRAAGLTAAYNLLSSAAALAGASPMLGRLPPAFPGWLIFAAVGGVLGSTIGSRYLPEKALRLVLAAVLTVSGLKLVLM